MRTRRLHPPPHPEALAQPSMLPRPHPRQPMPSPPLRPMPPSPPSMRAPGMRRQPATPIKVPLPSHPVLRLERPGRRQAHLPKKKANQPRRADPPSGPQVDRLPQRHPPHPPLQLAPRSGALERRALLPPTRATTVPRPQTRHRLGRQRSKTPSKTPRTCFHPRSSFRFAIELSTRSSRAMSLEPTVCIKLISFRHPVRIWKAPCKVSVGTRSASFLALVIALPSV